MSRKKKVQKLPLVVYTDKTVNKSGDDFDEVHVTKHGKKKCTLCQKDDVKIGKDSLCDSCRKDVMEE